MSTENPDLTLLRIQPIAQITTALAGVTVAGLGFLVGARFEPLSLGVGVALLAAVTVLMLRLSRAPRERSALLALIPLIDIVALSILLSPVEQYLGVAEWVLLLPLGWLALAFPLRWGLVGAGLTVIYPVGMAVTSASPASLGRVIAEVIAGPVMAALIVFVIHQFSRERQRVAKRLREESTEARARLATLQSILDSTGEGIFVFDVAGRLEHSNRLARRLALRARIDFRSPALGDHLIFASDRRTLRRFPDDSIDDILTREISIEQLSWVGPPGDQRAVRYRGFPIRVTGGDPVGVLVITTDVTELVEAVELRDQFLDAVGRELRSPLTVLIGEIELAMLGGGSLEFAERLERMDDAAQSLLQTIERLITSTRDAAGARDVGSVALALSDTVAELSALALERGVRVGLNDGPEARVVVGRRTLEVISRELLTNAILCTPSGGQVSVTVVPGDDRVRVEIADTGVGMTAAERSRAFERFYRTDYARDNAIPGVGVGLTIAQSIAELNDITVLLEPRPGGGTVAIMELPPEITDISAVTVGSG